MTGEKMTDDQYDRLKAAILNIAKELLAGSPNDTYVLYELQDFLGQINADEEGIDFGDSSAYSIKQIKNF